MTKPYVILLIDPSILRGELGMPLDRDGIVYELPRENRITEFILCDEATAKQKVRDLASKNPTKMYALMSPTFIAESVAAPVVEKQYNEENELVIVREE